MNERILILLLIIGVLGQSAWSCQNQISNPNLETGSFEVSRAPGSTNPLPDAGDAQVSYTLKSAFSRTPNVGVSLSDFVSPPSKMLVLLIRAQPANQTTLVRFTISAPKNLTGWIGLRVGLLAQALDTLQISYKELSVNIRPPCCQEQSQLLFSPFTSSSVTPLSDTPVPTFISGFIIGSISNLPNSNFSVVIKNSTASLVRNGILLEIGVGYSSELSMLAVSYVVWKNMDVRQGGEARESLQGPVRVQIPATRVGEQYNYSMLGIAGMKFGVDRSPMISMRMLDSSTMEIIAPSMFDLVQVSYLFIKVGPCFGCPAYPYLFQNTCVARCPSNMIITQNSCNCPPNSQISGAACVCLPGFQNLSGVCCRLDQYWTGDRCANIPTSVIPVMAKIQNEMAAGGNDGRVGFPVNQIASSREYGPLYQSFPFQVQTPIPSPAPKTFQNAQFPAQVPGLYFQQQQQIQINPPPQQSSIQTQIQTNLQIQPPSGYSFNPPIPQFQVETTSSTSSSSGQSAQPPQPQTQQTFQTYASSAIPQGFYQQSSFSSSGSLSSQQSESRQQILSQQIQSPQPATPPQSVSVCPPGSYFDPNQKNCKGCPKYCQTCASISLCTSCQKGFYLNGPNCLQICGKGQKYTLVCDDGNRADGDGCSSSCTIEPLWTCGGGSETTPDVCTYTKPEKVTIDELGTTIKDNTIQIKIKVNWLPAGFTASNCRICNIVLTVNTTQTPRQPHVSINYQPNSTYYFIISLQFQPYSPPPLFNVRIQINPSLQTPFFTGVDISNALDLRMQTATIPKRT